MVKVCVFSLSFLAKDTNGESFCFSWSFWPRIEQWKFCLVIFGQSYFYWPLWLWIPMMKVMFVIWGFEQPLASCSAKREFEFAEGNLWHPTVQAGVRSPGGNCWHGMVWYNHAFLWLKSRNNTNAARGNTVTSKITSWLHGDEKNIKIRNFRVSQLGYRVLTCWITKGWRKTTWVKFSASMGL